MWAQAVVSFLLLLLGLWLVWKYIIEPRIPNEPKKAEYVKILEDKLEKFQEMRAEYDSVKMERDVTARLKALDEEIEQVIREIRETEK